jgi:AcrR family transcriptional regulator
MAKETKEIIIRTLLNISSEEDGKMTIEEISKRSHITRTTIRKNFNGGISEIVEYMYLGIVDEVNDIIFNYKVEELSLDTFADVLLSVLWKNKDKARIIYTSKLPFKLVGPISDRTWNWAEIRFNNLVKVHGLSPYFSGKELLKYFNAQLLTVLTLWLSADIPIPPHIFKPKFMFLMSTSIKTLIYKDID